MEEDHLTPDLQAKVAEDSGSINAKEDDEEAWGKEVPLLKSHLDNEDKNTVMEVKHIYDEEDHGDGDPTSNQSISISSLFTWILIDV
ncbi:hypothetical protein QJS10_CPB18g00851 [Acorus calamus]|uniref:Uncharacterized protein n=1 Tax=Acorus calamus TaxID=4465 RepID=A0AAV9CP53_ACOCL|nr:hypothetical protein QJS10_CPB18g00851 [Acorus calamus]